MKDSFIFSNFVENIGKISEEEMTAIKRDNKLKKLLKS